MRKIKFRFWDKDDVKFVERPENVVMLGDGKIFDDWRDFEDYIETNSLIVSQFTGLADKNGVEIYEGDIVKHDCEAYGVITWIDERMQFGLTRGWCHPIYGNPPPNESEVIGNIYENPELLENGG